MIGTLKRRLLSLLLILLSLALFSCAPRLNADQLAFRLLNLYAELPPCTQYIKNAEPYTVGYLSRGEFAFLYTGRYEPLPEWERIADFRIILSDSTDFFEIHVIRTVTSGDTEAIEKLLRHRAALLSLHNKTEDAYPAKEPLIYISGRFAVLVATDNNEEAHRLLKKLL